MEQRELCVCVCEREKPRKGLDEEALLLARDRESRVPKCEFFGSV